MIETSGCELEEHKLVSDTHTFTYLLTDIQTDRQTVTLWRGWCSDWQVSGILAPKPVSSFAHFNFDSHLTKAVRKAGYSQPTPIQAQVSEWTMSITLIVSWLTVCWAEQSRAERSWAELSWLLSLRTDDFDMQNVCRPSGLFVESRVSMWRRHM